MSIFSMLEAALRAEGWALVRVPVNDRYKSLTELLIDDYVRRLTPRTRAARISAGLTGCG
jgi:hypothetical protein